MKRILTLLLSAAIACSCSTLSKINWDYDHLASAVANYCASNGLEAAQSITPALRAEVYDLAKL